MNKYKNMPLKEKIKYAKTTKLQILFKKDGLWTGNIPKEDIENLEEMYYRGYVNL